MSLSSSSTSAGQTCMRESMSGMLFEYPTEGGCLFFWISATELIHWRICLGFFYALSMAWTFVYLPPPYTLPRLIKSRSIFALSDWLRQGSSWIIHGFTRTYRPIVYGWPSGRGIFRKASTSPMAGMYSGTKAFNLVSSSVRTGVYLSQIVHTFEWSWKAI